jgi:hypothetical protein
VSSFSIRAARTSDIDSIIELAVESVTTVDPLPVTIDQGAMRDMAKSMIGVATQFVWVAEVDGKVVACVAATAARGFWFRGWQASMILFWSRVPGAGIALLRQLAEWIRGRPLIKLAVIECEPSIDPRALRFLRRLGFTRSSTNLVYVRQK